MVGADGAESIVFKKLNSNIRLQKIIGYEIEEPITDFSLINECLQASDAGWHCLGILTCTNFHELIDRKLTIKMINDICINAKVIMTTSYDGEGYIFWEKISQDRFDA